MVTPLKLFNLKLAIGTFLRRHFRLLFPNFSSVISFDLHIRVQSRRRLRLPRVFKLFLLLNRDLNLIRHLKSLVLQFLISVLSFMRLHLIVQINLLDHYEILPFELIALLSLVVGLLRLSYLILLLPIIVKLSLGSSFQDS